LRSEKRPRITRVNGAVGTTNGSQSFSNDRIMRNLGGIPQQGPTGSVLFDATAGATSTLQPVRHNAQMTDLGAYAKPAAKQAIVHDDGTAHTRANRKHGHVREHSTCPKAILSPACRVGIILNGGG
jgi:hypothetical protein